MSVEKTISAISQLYWFSGMIKYVKKYIGGCLEGLYNKEPGEKQKPGLVHSIEKVAVPFDTLHIDHLSPFVKSKRRNSYLIVIVDAFTKFFFMKAVQSTKVTPVITFLKSAIEFFGVARRIISDGGFCYTSQRFKDYCTSLKIKHVLNSTAAPKVNGQVERYNCTIVASLSSCSEDEIT
ncbi:uncharacterized protein K02A2.6-like [Diabrotica virgifera virgifera]|uniref:RNA-directed DNA polymerase n=1 Tax=Diabrotica virgifera virgifera TaxID=50390 RepID=A0ABM5KB78_DIAVI|nr:uncharacterized protein K02A2.6-like [Diabrotica virgifera virgifera]